MQLGSRVDQKEEMLKIHAAWSQAFNIAMMQQQKDA